MTMKYCAQCGARLTEGAKFCTSCGTPVAPAVPAAAASPDLPQPQAVSQTSYAGQPVPPDATAQAAAAPTPPLPVAPPRNPGQAPYAGPAVASAGTRRSKKGLVVGITAVVIVAIAAVAVALWMFLGAGSTRLDGRYTISSSGSGGGVLDIRDGSFTCRDNLGADDISGKIGRGEVDGDNVHYPITDLRLRNGDEMLTLSEYLTDVIDLNLAGTLADAATVTLTTPRDVAEGNVVGEWGISISLLTVSYEMSVTTTDDGAVSVMMSEPGYDPHTLAGTWSDLGDGRYALNVDGTEVMFSISH